MLIIALCGCSSKSANTIQLWDPAEEQAQVALEILTSGGHSAFAAYEVDKSYQTLKMGIEYYQDGKLVKDAKEGTIALRENEDNAKETHGIAGFLFQNGKATIGASAGASCSSCSDIDLPGFKAEDEESLASIGMPSAKNIADSEKIYLWAATGLHSTAQHLDAGEFLDVVKMPFDEALGLVMDGTIKDSKTQVALLKYAQLRAKV